MMFSWFAFFRDVTPLPALDPATLNGIATMLRDVPDLREGIVLSPTPAPTAHPFPDNQSSPALALQLRFDTIEALEAAVTARGPLRHLADAHRHKWLHGRTVSHQAMLTRRYNVPDALLRTRPGMLPCCYLVHYPGPAADINAWHAHYNTHHPPLMARFPGVRAIEIYTRIDWVSGLDWPREYVMQRNKLLFDSPEALTAGLLSPVLQEMRADFHQFPPFEGGNVHYVLQTRVIGRQL
jgi:uncharacterized protein (TIGR02118 family)